VAADGVKGMQNPTHLCPEYFSQFQSSFSSAEDNDVASALSRARLEKNQALALRQLQSGRAYSRAVGREEFFDRRDV